MQFMHIRILIIMLADWKANYYYRSVAYYWRSRHCAGSPSLARKGSMDPSSIGRKASLLNYRAQLCPVFFYKNLIANARSGTANVPYKINTI